MGEVVRRLTSSVIPVDHNQTLWSLMESHWGYSVGTSGRRLEEIQLIQSWTARGWVNRCYASTLWHRLASPTLTTFKLQKYVVDCRRNLSTCSNQLYPWHKCYYKARINSLRIQQTWIKLNQLLLIEPTTFDFLKLAGLLTCVSNGKYVCWWAFLCMRHWKLD